MMHDYWLLTLRAFEGRIDLSKYELSFFPLLPRSFFLVDLPRETANRG